MWNNCSQSKTPLFIASTVPRFLYYKIVPTHVPADKNDRGEVIRQQLCLTNSTLFLMRQPLWSS